ncbi:hypothetical protein Phi17218_033 [Cellulophaga phage phi17:2_18]|uniref:Uncharacterized protein n=2 Tax=Lightbulbvirus Cba172 TaxID=1918525 RepID=R9ZWU3_9CAUD|nr:hypothetical protein Phi17:2_gp033 [Cellulophaga phage phi17:2]AGO47566.1 hypothetical protein Phi17:2_gp033 [Cellulophaga phage phi17:2]ALO80436.1 hypothetical protein Phi17218_033 [Cellulophaga phage phi17:2_18]
MVNNFELIRPLLKWDNDDQFYFLQILQRKKDHTEGMKVSGANNNSRLIKAYYVKSLDYLEFVEPEIIALCELFNARAGINLNRRSFRKTALKNLKLVTDNIINENYDKVYKTYSSAAGKFMHDNNKKWIIDLDGEEENHFDFIFNMHTFLNNIEPEGDKTLCRIPSKSGSHIICSPFNMEKFKKEYPSIDVQKNNPTNLYIP